MFVKLLASAILALLIGSAAEACGRQSDCVISVWGKTRSYRIHLPEGAAPAWAILYHHGYRGSAAGAMKNPGLRALADRLGVALIAAQSDGDDWQIPNMPRHSRVAGSDALAYTDALLADVGRRFAIPGERILVAGFSAGAMMTWHLACQRGGAFAGFAPVAGTFWAPVPESCPSPAGALVHIHGTADKIVPMRGRAIGDARQGDLNEALSLYVRHGDFGAARGIRIGDMFCGLRSNAEGAVLEVCTHEGGHAFTAGLLAFALERLALVGRFPAGRAIPPGAR